MAATSLVKFMNERSSNGKPVGWGRADIDHAPFRGTAPPLMTEDEADERLVKVGDPDNRFFDLSDPEQNKAYLQVIDMITNGWAQLLRRKHISVRTRRLYYEEVDGKRIKVVERDVKIKVYMEWVKFFMEDGKPMESQRPYLGRRND